MITRLAEIASNQQREAGGDDEDAHFRQLGAGPRSGRDRGRRRRS
jgi:hypothetical protein